MNLKASNIFYLAGAISIPLSIIFWFFYKGDDRSRAERWGIFVGLWVPSLLIFGKVLEDRDYRLEQLVADPSKLIQK